MASDLILVLRSEHRHLAALAEQAQRTPRGFEDPVGELRGRLVAHLDVLASDVAQTAPRRADLVGALCPVDRGQLKDGEAATLVDLTAQVTEHERAHLLPLLEGLPLPERRRMGRVYRIRRDARLRTQAHPRRRMRSQSELYELARRAGVEQRSRMTQQELEHALADGQRSAAD